MTAPFLQVRLVPPASGPLREQLRNVMAGARASHRSPVVRVVATAPYAYGIETGRTRGGRLARRAGAAWYLRDASRAHRDELPRRLADALPAGERAVLEAWMAVGTRIEEAAQETVPVVTGALRRSIQTVPAGGSPRPFTGGGRPRRPR